MASKREVSKLYHGDFWEMLRSRQLQISNLIILKAMIFFVVTFKFLTFSSLANLYALSDA